MKPQDLMEMMVFVEECLSLDPESRQAFLAQKYQGRTELLTEARELLCACDKVEHFMDQPLLDPGPFEIPRPEPLQVGPYHITCLLGKGGMGDVYLAQQQEPVVRKVALKMLKWELGHTFGRIRFQEEYRILARMNHPNIASIFDAGYHDKQPYFTMEYFHSEPLTEWCASQQPNLLQRLEVFVQACEGVAHAHIKGIIHRDIKPSNLMVAQGEHQPLLKVIDFGIAKVFNREADLTALTGTHQILGTPAYMSPEQLDGGRDVDMRTDVYGLGAVLYQLLSGYPAFDNQILGKCGLAELIQTLKFEEPLPPSIVAQRKGQHTAGLSSREIGSELDWITVKAMAKNREDRYSSVTQLREDIVRFLNQEAIIAGPPSIIYKVRKWVVRHRGAVLAIGLLLLLLMALTNAYLQRRESRESSLALQEFMTTTLDASNPWSPTPVYTLEAFLERASNYAQSRFRKFPLFEARALQVIGTTYASRGRYHEALKHQRRAHQLCLDALGVKHPETQALFEQVGYCYFHTSQWRQAKTVYEKLLAEKLPPTLFLKASRGLANALWRLGDLKIAEVKIRALLPQARKDPFEYALTLSALANILSAGRNLQEADALWKEAHGILAKQVPKNHPELLSIRFNLALILLDRGQPQKAGAAFKEIVELRSQLLGETHPETLRTMSMLGRAYNEQEHFSEAKPTLMAAYQLLNQSQGEDDALSLEAGNNLTIALAGDNQLEQAVSLAKNLVILSNRIYGPTHTETFKITNNLADYLLRLSRYHEASELLLGLLPFIDRTLGNTHNDSLILRCTLAECLIAEHRYQEALPYLEHITRYGPEAFGKEAYLPAIFEALLGRALLRLKTYPAAERALLKAWNVLEHHNSAYQKQLYIDLLALYSVWHAQELPSWRARSQSL